MAHAGLPGRVGGLGLGGALGGTHGCAPPRAGCCALAPRRTWCWLNEACRSRWIAVKLGRSPVRRHRCGPGRAVRGAWGASSGP
jgi:hypothetical protein